MDEGVVPQRGLERLVHLFGARDHGDFQRSGIRTPEKNGYEFTIQRISPVDVFEPHGGARAGRPNASSEKEVGDAVRETRGVEAGIALSRQGQLAGRRSEPGRSSRSSGTIDSRASTWLSVRSGAAAQARGTVARRSEAVPVYGPP